QLGGRAQKMRRLRQDGITSEQGVRKRTKQFCGPRRGRVLVLWSAESSHQRPGVHDVDHGDRECMALRTFRLVAGGASVLTLPSRSSQGDPALACTACTRCRTALRANSLRCSPTAFATFCQASFSLPGTLSVSVSLILCV